MKWRKNRILKQFLREKLGDELASVLMRRADEGKLGKGGPETQPPLECRILVSKAKWKLMKASFEAKPGRETGGKNWKRLISEAHEYAFKASGELRKYLSDSLIFSHVAVSEPDAMYSRLQGIVQDSSLLLNMNLDNLYGTCSTYFANALSLSTDDAHRRLYELYVERMILPVYTCYFMLYEVDCKIAEQKGDSSKDPATLFSIGLREREKADEILNWARKSKNFDEWLVRIYRCAPLYREATLFFQNAAKEELDPDKREDYLREEHSAEEMWADCYTVVETYGMSHIGCILDIWGALEHGVAAAKRAAFFSYSARPMLPEFAYRAIDDFLSQTDTKSISEHFLRNFETIIIKNLDDKSVKLFNAAKLENSKK